MCCLVDQVHEERKDFDNVVPLCCSGVNLVAVNKLFGSNASSPSKKLVTDMFVLPSALSGTAESKNSVPRCMVLRG